MPKIPIYTATVDYKPPRGDLKTAALPGEMLTKLGGALGTFGHTILEHEKSAETAETDQLAKQTALQASLKGALDEITRANSTAQWRDELSKISATFRVDPEPQTVMERFRARVDDLGQDVTAGIDDPEVRARVEHDMSGLVGVQAALLQGDSLRRLSAQGRQDLDNHLTLYAGVAAGARHPLEHDEALDLAFGEIQRKVEAGFIADADAANLKRTFYADVAERQVRHAIAADPDGTLASLEDGEDFAALPVARRARLIEEAARAVQARMVAHTTAAAADRRAMEIRLPGFVTALRDGALPEDHDRFSRESLTATFGDHDGARHWAAIEDARAFGKETIRVKWAAPDEVARLLGGDADADAPDGATSAPSLLRQAVDRRNEQLWSKPADYALANPRIAELHGALRQTTAQPQLPTALTAALQASGVPAPAIALSHEDRHAAAAAYANATLAEQERLGLPADRRQVLPAAEAQALVARILGSDTKAAADTLSDLIATWGEAAPTALADLSRHGLPGEYRLLASLADPVAHQTLVKVLTMQATDPGALRGKLGNAAEAIDGFLHGGDDPAGNGSINLLHLVAAPDRFAGGDVNKFSGIGQPRRRGVAKPDSNVFVAPEDRAAIRQQSVVPPKAVPLFDDNGDPVMVWNVKQGRDVQVQIPDDVTLNYFARVGLEDRSRSLSDRLVRLSNFLRGEVWDLQRAGLRKDSSGKVVNFAQFVDVATIAIGVYCAAADIPLNTLLDAQSAVARSGNYGNVVIDGSYAPLPLRNVANTELGYYLYNNGKIRPK